MEYLKLSVYSDYHIIHLTSQNVQNIYIVTYLSKHRFHLFIYMGELYSFLIWVFFSRKTEFRPRGQFWSYKHVIVIINT